ncbi:MAG TPA: hypothetical protein VE781_07525 [Kineosporiaceae bacterium]|jgi:hypothetical protein|nr:hypothetical protein [Kineosporiaceae bacterium]
MRLRALSWFTLIWALVPLAAVAEQLYLAAAFSAGASYPLAEQVRAYGAGVLVQPVTSLCCCLIGVRLRRSEVLRSVAVARPRVVVLLHLLALPAAAVTAVLVFTMGAYSRALTADAVPDARLVLAAALASAAYAALGLALGSSLPPVLAAPAAVAAPYVVMAFPPAMQTTWVRHLTGISSGCCQIYQDLSTRAFVAHLLFLCAVLVGSAAVFVRSSRGARSLQLALSGVSAGCLVLAALPALPLDASPVARRPGEPTCRSVETSQLCLWPEHEAARADGERAVSRVLALARTSGVSTPKTYTELDANEVNWPSTVVEVLPGGGAQGALNSVVSSLYPSRDCLAPDPAAGGDPDASLIDVHHGEREVVTGWWARQLGTDVSEAENDPEAAAEVARLQRLPFPQQVAAVNAMIATGSACPEGSRP